MTNLEKALATNFKAVTSDKFGEFGAHDGFFNAIAVIEGNEYSFQACIDGNGSLDLSDCGHDWGISGDVNHELASKLAEGHEGDVNAGYSDILDILSAAWDVLAA